MKEVKAFIRQHSIADVLQALRRSGLCELAYSWRKLPQHHGIPGATATGEPSFLSLKQQASNDRSG